MVAIEIDSGPDLPPKTDYGIGCIGAGFIMKDIHLVAYGEAGFDVVAIASRTPANARAAADERGVGTVYDTWHELLDDERVEIVDIAFPPDQQLGIVREAVQRPHIKGILAQKPVAFTLDETIELVRLCDDAGVKLGVNHNMRYDQSMRVLKSLLDGGVLGDAVVAEIVMNARPHWQEFIKPYGRIALLNMSIHHLDAFRYLFGDPERILASVRDDPSHDFPHGDGLAFYILEYAGGLRAIGLDNCYTWADHRIEWRVEGTEGLAKGTIGWPDYPAGSPSTIDWTTRALDGVWEQPRWDDRWFPQAFKGTMGQLMRAIADDTEPAISGRTTLGTMALVEAAYRSAAEGRAVPLAEILPADARA
ncbi:MAG: Gfo/Idh/MocA family protein [Gaiella sp.]